MLVPEKRVRPHSFLVGTIARNGSGSSQSTDNPLLKAVMLIDFGCASMRGQRFSLIWEATCLRNRSSSRLLSGNGFFRVCNLYFPSSPKTSSSVYPCSSSVRYRVVCSPASPCASLEISQMLERSSRVAHESPGIMRTSQRDAAMVA